MKSPLIAPWVLLALGASPFAPPPCAAQGAPPVVPQFVQAGGRSQPDATYVSVSWRVCPGAQGYRVYRDGQSQGSVLPPASARAGWSDYAVAPGEAHAYAVSSTGPGGESAPSAPATASVPAGGGRVVYADGLQNGWQSWGWADEDFANAAPARSARSIRVTAGPWQAAYLHHAPLDTSPYVAVRVWMHGGRTGGQRLYVLALRGGVPQTPVALPPLPPYWRHFTIPLAALGVADVSDLDGLWVQDATGTSQPTFYLDTISLTYATLPTLPAPSGLSVTPQWVTSCPTCGGMAMAHLALAWGAVPGATGYAVCRDGVSVAQVSGTGWTDMAVTSGRTYAYTVAALGPGGPSPVCAPVSGTAPSPPPSAVTLTAPVNLAVQGAWLTAPTDILSWSPVPGAASYNVYQYGTAIAQNVTVPTYAVPADVYSYGMTYAVTAVDAMGMETLPSAIATAQGGSDPAQQPSWMPDAPSAPTHLVATPEWNAGGPRIHLAWQGWQTAYTYNVYRDGAQVASGLWGLNYYDTAVAPGETHAYTVTAVNRPWTTPVESLPSGPVSATAPPSAPSAPVGVVQITGVQPDDDSAVVSFAAVPGAMDYRVYDMAHPNTVKYSGGGLSVEMNGLDPAGATLVIEAVDKLGPFQTMDGKAGPGAMSMGAMRVAINGQGDPSDVPLVLAASAPFPVTLSPLTLAGSQVFFDAFRGEQPLALQPLPPARLGDFYGLAGQYSEYANDKWAFRNYGGDIADSAVFFMGSHFMDTLFDGGTPHTSDPMHNNDASLVMMPRATADISGGQVLHVTFEVDAHFDSRRWCDVQIAAAGDTLIQPGKVVTGSGPNLSPTVSGTELRWQIDGEFHHLMLFQNAGTAAAPDIRETDMVHTDWQGDNSDRFGPCARVRWDGTPLAEGTAQDLDKRHRFDLYLSQTHYRLMENGAVCKDGDFPAGATLPFSQCQVYFVHQIYHTSNDRNEQVDYSPQNAYWYNYRPFSDERHWDACGEEVLSAFPALP